MKPIITAIELSGVGQSGFARLINDFLHLEGSEAVTAQQVWNWVNRDGQVPPQYCWAIERLSQGRVTRKHLCPNDWPKIWPDLCTEPTAEAAP